MGGQRKVLFLFLDGVGLGEDNPETNPFAWIGMPEVEKLLDGHKLVAGSTVGESNAILADSSAATLLAVDACLGVEGLPQSATGQAALLTGKNVSAWLGEHEGPKPTPPIAELLHQGTIFTRLQHNGRSISILNAFPPRYFESIERDYRLPGVIALSARQAGLQVKTKDDLYAGNAISADFTGEGWRSHLGFPDAPVLSYTQVGERLIALASQADLSVFEYWLTDMAGHHQDKREARLILQGLDEVIGQLASHWDADQGIILVTSDHGNLEDLGTRHHTRNDVPLLLIGANSHREEFIQLVMSHSTCRTRPDLTDIGPAMVRFIG